MTTYNTGNPIGSKDPRDLYDNAENLDEAVNTHAAESWDDRFGVARKTWWGMEQDFQQFLINSGYDDIGDYGPGIEITARNQIFWRDGELYRAGAALELPYTTTGDWGEEESLFVAVGDAALRQELSAPYGAAMVGVRQAGSGAVERSVDDKLKEYVSVKDVGAVGDGIADDTEAFQLAVNTGRQILVPNGRYKVTSEITGDALFIRGEAGAIIDATEAGFSGGSVFSASGSLETLPDMDIDASVGSLAISFTSPHGLLPGDIFCIWNSDGNSFSGFRNNYYAGEWCTVQEVISPTEVRLSGRLWASYAADDVQLLRLNQASANISNLTILGNESENLITLEKVAGARVSSLNLRHKNNAALNISRSVGVTIDGGCDIRNEGAGGDDYGIVVSNSQDVRGVGGQIYSRRHSIAHGGGVGPGSVPCRNCYTIGATLTNDFSSGTHNADFHGNVEGSWFIDCDIQGGASLQGKNNGIRGGRITSMITGPVIYAAEVIGGAFTLDGGSMEINHNPQTTIRGVIDFGGNSPAINEHTIERFILSVTHCKIRSDVLTNLTSLVTVRNNGSNAPLDVSITGLDINVNNFGQILFMDKLSGSAVSNGIEIGRITGSFPSNRRYMNASEYTTFPLRLPRVTGSHSVTMTSGTSITESVVNSYSMEYPRTPHVKAQLSAAGVIGNVPGIDVVQNSSASQISTRVVSTLL